MAANEYDVIVVGARCAGSPTAMLLARQGYRVLLVDRATFPSDTISTHVIQPTGIAALNRWGLLGQLLSTGCPPVGTYAFDFGPFTIAGSPGTDDSPVAYAPRRTVLEELLVGAATSAGAEVREGFTVQEVLTDGGRVTGIRGRGKGGQVVSEHARVVIGADGLHSVVAATVGPEHYHESHHCCAATTRTGAACRRPADSRTTSGPIAAGPPAPPMTTSPSSSPWPSPSSPRTRPTSKATTRRTSTWHQSSPSESAPPAAKRASSAPPFPTTPPTLRSRLGAGRRRWLQQGPHHRAGYL